MSEDSRKIFEIDNRRLSVIVFSLFFSWLLAFPFEGRILYALADYHHILASSFVFGENNQVAVAFGDIKEKLGPVSSLIGLVTLNPADIGKKAKDTVDAVVYISDSLVDLFYEDKIVGIKVEGLSDQAVAISGEVFEAGAKAAIEAAGFLCPETVKTLSQLAGLWEPEPEVMIARMDALVSQMAELERATGITGEVSPEPGSTESTIPQAPAGYINIFGRYSVVSRATNSDDEEETTHFVTILDLGQGKAQWIDEEDEDEDEFEDEEAPIIMSYDASTHKLRYFEEGFAFDAAFTISEGVVTGSGYMNGSLWGERFEATLSLTKVSD